RAERGLRGLDEPPRVPGVVPPALPPPIPAPRPPEAPPPAIARGEDDSGGFRTIPAPIYAPDALEAPAEPSEPAEPPAAADGAAGAEVVVEPEPDFQAEIRRRHVGALVHLPRNQAAARGPLPLRLSDITETAADVLGVSRASIYTYDADRNQIVCQDLYRRGEQTHESGLVQSAADYPLYFAALKSERPMAAQDASRDPRTREFDVSYLDPHGIRSMLDVPVVSVGRMVGLLRLEQVGESHAWE